MSGRLFRQSIPLPVVGALLDPLLCVLPDRTVLEPGVLFRDKSLPACEASTQGLVHRGCVSQLHHESFACVPKRNPEASPFLILSDD